MSIHSSPAACKSRVRSAKFESSRRFLAKLASRRLQRRLAALSVLLVGSGLGLGSLRADDTWTGGSSVYWNDAGNWNNGLPTASYGTLTFATSTNSPSNDNIAATSQNKLLMTTTGSFEIDGTGTISLFDNGGTQSKIENNSGGTSGTFTLNNATINFAATSGATFGEINAVTGNILFGTNNVLNIGTQGTTNPSSVVAGIKMYGGGNTTTFNNTVNASGKYFSTTATGDTVAIGGTFTSGNFDLMNSGVLNLSGSGFTTTDLRLGGDYGNDANAASLGLGATLNLTAATGGQTFASTINTVSSNTSGALIINSQNTSGTDTLSGGFFLDSNLAVNSTAGGTLVLGAASSTNTISFQSPGTSTVRSLTVGGGGSTTINEAFTNVTSGAQQLNVTGGTVTLAADNSGSGANLLLDNIQGGTLAISTANNLGSPTVTNGYPDKVLFGTSAGGTTSTLLVNGTFAYGSTTSGSVLGFAINRGTAANTGVINVSGTNTLTLNGALSDNGTSGASSVFQKTGAGTLVLSASSNAATLSNFQVNAGTVSLTGAGSSGGVLQNTAMITVGGTGSTLLVNGSSNDVLGYTIGAEALTINSGGSVLNNAANTRATLDNTVTMTGGTLGGSSTGDSNGGAFSFNVSSGNAVNATSDASGNSAVISAVTTLQSPATFNVTRGTGTADLTVTGAINQFNGGGNGFTKTGNGILLLEASNGYTGTTTISGGTLQLGDGATKGGYISSGSIVDNATLVYGNISNQSYGGNISGTGAVTVANASGIQEVFTATNTYTGTTTISSGILQLGNLSTGGALSPSSTIVDNSSLIFYRSNTLTQGTDFGLITGTGNLLQGGSSTATLTLANTFSGTTNTASTGSFILANQYALQNSTLLTGAVAFSSTVTGNAFTIGGLGNSPGIALVNNATTPAAIALTIGNNNQAATYGGTLTGAGSLIKVGTGNQTFSGNSTYTGTTTINGGTLTLSGGGNAGGALAGTPSIAVNSGGTLSLIVGDTLGYTSGKEALFINGTGVVINSVAANRDTLQNTVTMVGGTLTSVANTNTNGAYSFDVVGGGLNATSDASGNVATVSGGPVSLQATNPVFNITRGSTAPAVDAVISSAIINYNSNSYGLTKTGNGVLQLSGANTFTGGLVDRAGTILLTGSLASQSLTMGGTGNGAAFNYVPATSGSTQTLSGFNLSGGANTVSAAGGSTLALGSYSRNSYGMTVNFNPASTGTITTTTANDSTGIISAATSYGSGTGLSYATASGSASPYTIAAYTAGTTYTGANAAPGTNFNLAASATTSTTAGTVNTLRYTGAAGTLTISTGSKLTTAGLMNAGTGTLTINGPTVTGTASGTGIGAGNGTLGELVVFGNTQPIVFNTSIVDNYNSVTSTYNSSSATFSTAGTVTLNALNTYRGATTVDSGTVVANFTNGLATTSGVAVATGAVFSVTANNAFFTPVAPATTSTTAGTSGTVTPATGQVQVAVTLNGGTMLRNGAGVNLGSGTTVGAGALTLNLASTLDFGTTSVGTLNFNSFTDANNVTLTVADFTHSANGTGTDGTDDRLIFNEPLTAAQLADISFGNGLTTTETALGNGEFEISAAAVPEPATWMSGALCFGLVGFVARGFRRGRKARAAV